MNIFTPAAIFLLLMVVRGSDVPGERKRMGCYYMGVTSERYGTMYPEDIDVSICTHLVFLHGFLNNETQEIYLQSPMQEAKSIGEDILPRLLKLKAANPELKLILHVVNTDSNWLSQESSRRRAVQNGVKWLNESGFDGLEFDATHVDMLEMLGDFTCEMKNEFDKYGFSVTTSLTGPLRLENETINNIARCSEHLALVADHPPFQGAFRLSPMSMMRSNVDWYLEKGVPANKIILVLPNVGLIFTLADPEETGIGARISGPGNDDRNMMGGVGIPKKELLRKMNDSSVGWTIRRDNETQEPYAFSTTGLWTSYEDTASVEYKARYVLEKKLGGMDLFSMEFEDDEGIGGEGKFPLMRTIYETFTGGNQSVNTSN